MSKKKPNIKERVLLFADFQENSKQDFFRKTGLNYSNFTGKSKESDLTSGAIEEILLTYKELSPDWLISGKGEMIREELSSEIEKKQPAINSAEKIGKIIPLVSATAVGGHQGSVFEISDRDIKEYYRVPKFDHKQVDFMIEVEGSSMYPKYNSGDVVACRKIHLDSFIQWNKCHVIATRDQGIIIKRIKKGSEPGLLNMVSDNKDYDPFEISLEDIDGIALVVGVIRIE